MRDAWLRIGIRVVPGDVPPRVKLFPFRAKFVGMGYAYAHLHETIPKVGPCYARHRERHLPVHRDRRLLCCFRCKKIVLPPYQSDATGFKIGEPLR